MNQNSLNKIIKETLAIDAREAKEAGALGYMGRALVQATMPHKQASGNEFVRKNGAFTLAMLSPSEIGLPYGSIPRLLTAWITTEAVRTKQQELILGPSLSGFMSQLGLIPTGGRWGSITRLRDQMKRLFSASISCTYENSSHEAGINMQLAEEYHLWWEPKAPEQTVLWDSTLKLSNKFFDEITTNPVPLDMDALKLLKRSPMALDVYCWLTYRMSYLKRQTSIPWIVLQTQFGADYATSPQGLRDFKRAFLRELKKVHIVYSTANVEPGKNNLTLKPSQTHIPTL